MIKLRLHNLPKSFLGLQAKACMALTVIVVITAAAIGGTAFRKVRTQMLEAAAGQATATARLVATASAEKYAARDTAGLVGLCQHLTLDPNLLYVAFLDPDGRIVAVAQKPHTFANLLDARGQHLTVRPVEGVQVRRLTGETYALEACVPIPAAAADPNPGRKAATLLLASDLGPLRARLASMARRGIELTSIVAVCVIAGGYVVMSRLVRPINKLADASLDLAYKHEFQQLPAGRSDELGRLTQAFNHMAERLLRTQKELLELNGELERRVALRTVELETRNKQLRRIASKDPLTGLYNRRSFNELLGRQIAEARRHDQQIACMMIDLDNFKKVNDVCGHQAGDVVLSQTARIICREVRRSDIVARYGGDEFIVLMPQCNATQAFHLAKRIRKAARAAFGDAVKTVSGLSLSIGIADLHTSGATSGEMLVRAADQALYHVKSMGKDAISARTEPVQAA
jgi:diguanylate cyclase (GGDEF)-like protein